MARPKKQTKLPDFTQVKLEKGEKLVLVFPNLKDYDQLLNIKEKASSVFGSSNVLVIMGNVNITKVKGA